VPASYTVKNLSEVADSAPQFGLEEFQKTRFAHGDLETEQTGFPPPHRSHDAIRVAPSVTRAWEAGAEGLELLAFGPHHEDDGEVVLDWWTD